jgi:hypothetical protein
MGLIVTPPHETDWIILPEDFSRLLHRDWIVVKEEILDTSNINESGHWIIKFGVYDAQLFTFHNSNALHLDCDVMRGVILAHWYRQFVPTEIELHLVDGDGNWSVLIQKPFLEGETFNHLIQGDTTPFWATKQN